MRAVSEREREVIRQEIAEEFPGDELMQEIHSVRRIHQLETEGMSLEERNAYYRQKSDRLAARASQSTSSG